MFRNVGFGQRRPTKTANTHVSCFVVSEGTGWAARLRRVINARLEEMSFRSGVTAFVAVLALTGTGIVLAVVLSGGHQAAGAPPAVHTSAAPASAAPRPSASALPSPSAGSSAIQDAPAPAQAASQPAQTTQASSPQASPSATSPWPTPRTLWPRPSYASPPSGHTSLTARP